MPENYYRWEVFGVFPFVKLNLIEKLCKRFTTRNIQNAIMRGLCGGIDACLSVCTVL